MILKAFCDESHDSSCVRNLAVAGFLGEDRSWNEFEYIWQALLRTFDLSNFHMVECEKGKGEFADKSRTERKEIQRAFINAITGSNLFGVACGIHLDAYTKARKEFNRLRRLQPGGPVSGSLGHPWYLAFQFALERFAMKAISERFPRSAKIETVFDQQSEFASRAKVLYKSLCGSTTLEFVERLGGIDFADRRTTIPLQAADVLAYEFFQWMEAQSKGSTTDRWQWVLLRTKLSEWNIIPDEAIPTILSDFEPEG